jgi:hypothetical protein
MQQVLDSHGFKGRLLVLPQWGCGVFGTEGPSKGSKTFYELPNVDENLRGMKFCKDSVMRLHQGSNEYREAFREWCANRPSKQCGGFLDVYGTMLRARERDSKASIYPFTFGSGKNRKICEFKSKQSRYQKPTGYSCEKNENWHIMSDAALRDGFRPEPESHFCMPGPLDGVLRLLLAALLE